MHIEEQFEIQSPLKETPDVRVYKSLDRFSKKEVVLKLVRIGGVFPISDYKTYLQHKNIVKCFDIKPKVLFQENEYHLSVLEHVHASSLYKNLSKIKEQPFAFVFQIFQAITYLHDNNITHGDIKSDNILVKQENNQLIPVVMDYSTFFTEGSQKAVTPEYLAPEYETGFSIQTDVWAMGCLLFEIFTGTQPFGSRKDGLTLNQVLANSKNKPLELPF
jgi:serine/threonine protein kinase